MAIWKGRARDYAGRSWDTSAYYRPENPSHFLRLGMLYGLRPGLFVNTGLYIDTGLDAPAMRISPYGGLTVTLIALPRRDLTLSFGVADLVSVGGKVREIPCRDGFNRAFHCGTVLPWTDYQAVAPDFAPERRVFGRVQVRF